MTHCQEPVRHAPSSALPPAMAPMLMIAFWMLLGAAFGIRLLESVWRHFDIQVGELSIVVPVGGVVGALGGALLGLISNPRLLVLLMAVFAGSAAGAVAGKLPWGDIGEIGGQLIGGLVGGIAWAIWLYFGPGWNAVEESHGTHSRPGRYHRETSASLPLPSPPLSDVAAQVDGNRPQACSGNSAMRRHASARPEIGAVSGNGD